MQTESCRSGAGRMRGHYKRTHTDRQHCGLGLERGRLKEPAAPTALSRLVPEAPGTPRPHIFRAQIEVVLQELHQRKREIADADAE